MLDKELCMGCINCIKRCPTEAIRVRDGKAHILKERCIDCGECIRICPHHAKKAITDPVSILENFQYTIALPPPSLYGQYNNLEEQDLIAGSPAGHGLRQRVRGCKGGRAGKRCHTQAASDGQHEPACHQLCLSCCHTAHPRSLP